MYSTKLPDEERYRGKQEKYCTKLLMKRGTEVSVKCTVLNYLMKRGTEVSRKCTVLSYLMKRGTEVSRKSTALIVRQPGHITYRACLKI